MKVDLYTSAGEKNGQVSVEKTVFGAKVNEDLMHRAVVMRLANARTPIAHTKTRAEIIGTTKKAFRQKGTGNARRGAMKTSLLRGGGVAHGPRNTANYSKAMPKKERRAALFSALTLRMNEKNIFALEGFAEKAPKTKAFAGLLGKLPEGKKYLFVVPEKNMVLEKSMANIPNAECILASYLNPYDVLNSDKVCFLKDALPVVENTFLSQKK